MWLLTRFSILPSDLFVLSLSHPPAQQAKLGDKLAIWLGLSNGCSGHLSSVQVGEKPGARSQHVWVPRVLDGLVLFVEKSDPAKVDKEAEAEHPAGSAILEQQDQVQRFQSWWAEGKGMVGARSHPMLSILDATVLGDIIAAGANYHNCLSADRLDTLQRHVSVKRDQAWTHCGEHCKTIRRGDYVQWSLW